MRATINTKSFSTFVLLAAGRASATGALSASSSDLAHVLAVLAYYLSTLLTGTPGFITIPFMCYALLVRSTTAFAGNLLLSFGTHRGKAPVGGATAAVGAVIAAATALLFVFGRFEPLVPVVLPVIILIVHLC